MPSTLIIPPHSAGKGPPQKLLPKARTAEWTGVVTGPLPWSIQIQNSLGQKVEMPDVITKAATGNYPSSVQLKGARARTSRSLGSPARPLR